MQGSGGGSTPAVSVIVPCYNYSKYIAECLQAIKGQTYTNFEVIVVDDGSTDNSKEVVSRFLTDRRFRYVYQENKGLCGARNTGIRNSIGEFICIVDPDDIWFPDKLERQIEYMGNHDECGLVYSDAEIFTDGEPTGETVRKGKLFYNGWCFEKMIMDNGVVCPSVMIRRECFQKLGLFDEIELKQYSEDWDMWLRIAHEYEIGSIKKPLLYYRVHGGNMSNAKFRLHLTNILITLRRHLPKLRDPMIEEKCFEHNMKKILLEAVRRNDVKMVIYTFLCLVSSRLLRKQIWPKVAT